MAEKFQNKYRIPSTRAPWWDYGKNAAYFITICTKNREHFFGKIVPVQTVSPVSSVETRLIASLRGHPIEFEMQLSPLGKIARQYYFEIPDHFRFVVLDEFVVMPDHIHAILFIDKPETKNISPDYVNAETRLIASQQTRLIASLTPQPQPNNKISEPTKSIGGFAGRKNPMLNENLSRVLRWYKGRTSFECRKLHACFAWQPRFHDHIIRNEGEYQRIKNYIRSNPHNWEIDKLKD